MTIVEKIIENLAFNEQGLIPAIAQDVNTKEVLMMAWMNPQSIRETFKQGYAIYWSRSRNALWKKGETSGHLSKLVEFRYDCDADTILMFVEQVGPACHTGRKNCFFYQVKDNAIHILES